jgi:hypothetical protein
MYTHNKHSPTLCSGSGMHDDQQKQDTMADEIILILHSGIWWCWLLVVVLGVRVYFFPPDILWVRLFIFAQNAFHLCWSKTFYLCY